MKKFYITAICILALVFGLSSCSNGNNDTKKSSSLSKPTKQELKDFLVNSSLPETKVENREAYKQLVDCLIEDVYGDLSDQGLRNILELENDSAVFQKGNAKDAEIMDIALGKCDDNFEVE